MVRSTRRATSNDELPGGFGLTTTQRIVPPPVVARLYEHVEAMRRRFFDGRLPEVVLSFEVTDRRVLGQHRLKRTALGAVWTVNLNPVHLSRPACEVLATLLHELTHAWQGATGTAGRSHHHNAQFVARSESFGLPTDARGAYLGVRPGSAFERYCQRHGAPVPAARGGDGPAEPAPEPFLPGPAARPRGSRLRKWICGCEKPRPVRVASDRFDATCNRCGEPFRRA